MVFAVVSNFHPNIIYCLCVLVLGENVYDFKGVLPVEDHEFQRVTQIQIFKLQY